MTIKPENVRRILFCLLALLLFALGIFIVPAHWNSIWADRSFTDWTTPISNQLHGQSRLYETGLHSPLPPLPFVLVYLLHPRGAIWIDESLLNYFFQATAILFLFWIFSKNLDIAAIFVTTLAVIPVFLSMSKNMLYDSMAQFLVVTAGFATAQVVQQRSSALKNKPATAICWLPLAFLGSQLALLLLTKQNSGAGVVLAACLTLCFLPRSINFRHRCANIFLTILMTCAFLCIVGLALNRFANFSGMIHDVFLTGSEPKGGSLRLMKYLAFFFVQMGMAMGGLYLLLCIFNFCVGTDLPSWNRLVGGETANAPLTTIHATPSVNLGLLAGGVAGCVAGIALCILFAKTGVSLRNTMMENAWPTLLLNLGLGLTSPSPHAWCVNNSIHPRMTLEIIPWLPICSFLFAERCFIAFQ